MVNNAEIHLFNFLERLVYKILTNIFTCIPGMQHHNINYYYLIYPTFIIVFSELNMSTPMPSVTVTSDMGSTVAAIPEPPMPGWAIVVTGMLQR